MPLGFRNRLLLPLGLGLLRLLCSSASAQKTAFALNATTNATTYHPGDTVDFNIILSSTLAPGDNISSVRGMFAYALGPNNTTPVSPFSTVSESFTSSPFASINTAFTAPAVQVRNGSTDYLGASFNLFNNPPVTPQGDTFIGTINASLRADLTPGTYTFQYENLPNSVLISPTSGDGSGNPAGLSRIQGGFGGAPGTIVPTLGSVTITVVPVPEAATSVSLVLLLGCVAWSLRQRDRLSPTIEGE